MTFLLIACNVFQREACHCVARTPHLIDVEFLDLGQHANSQALRSLLQARIDAAATANRTYDAILLLYGVCGNATVGLHNRTNVPLIMPRAHDCATVLLGSRQAFQTHFGAEPSTPFSSVGYLERGDYFLRPGVDGKETVVRGDAYAAMVEQYGEEDARYIWETMHPATTESSKAVFIDIPETAHLGYAEQCQQQAEAEGRHFLRLVGSLRLIEGLIKGEWTADEFLVVPPGATIEGVYDSEEIVRISPIDNK